jgi:hypothetical protein
MPVVKNRVSSEASRQVAQAAADLRLPPVIGLASRHAFRAAKCFEYWNLEFLWSLKFVSLEFPFPAPGRQTPDTRPDLDQSGSVQPQASTSPTKSR